ncbi:sigma-54-dependent Fis family transcriptional regulator [Comamonas sp. J-3]|uniref:sigma-54-dependent Fis family transcriptional regulator n=1 Tax=Comamonas trifloxystrobinivorans TaxID=3350256 RepID=UPI00372AD076
MPVQSYSAHVQELEAFGMGYPLHGQERDRAVLGSWRRCIDQHRLDPSHTSDAHIVPAGQLRAHQEESEPLIHIARSGLERLYQQLKGLDYVLLLADQHGVAVDFLGHDRHASDLRNAGLYLGAQWREDTAGTSAVGTCLATGEAITVHQSDHFNFTHTTLSCSAAPIYNLQGELAAVLDLSLLRSPAERASQQMALHLVTAAARRVELANLMAQSGSDWVLRLAQSPDFLDVDTDVTLSIDPRGRIRAMTHAGARMLATSAGLDWRQRQLLAGKPLSHFFDVDTNQLPLLMRDRPALERILRARDGSIWFALALAPQERSRAPATSRPSLQPALQALDTGDAAVRQVLQKAAKLAPQNLPILVQGETGSGKEFLARALHAASGRSGAFIAINCAAIPEALLESELFGYLPGTWTGGASKGRPGLIEAADHGTLFLDEIGDMPLTLQAKLLRVLSESEITPLGARAPRKVDIRVISASHRPLAELAAAGSFRSDLLYRLNAAELRLPALRERSDISTLAKRMLAHLGCNLPISETALAALQSHHWPGNLRELHNALRYAAALADQQIDTAHLPDALQATTAMAADSATPQPAPAASLEQVLAQCNGNVSEAARLLGVNRSTIHRRIQRQQLSRSFSKPG